MNYFVELTAEVCHEFNKKYCETLNDFSQQHWYDAPEWQKQSVMNGVVFYMNNPETTPEESHNDWCRNKVKDGWVYGEVKDADAKTHPCLVDYNELPVDQRTKDIIFSICVKNMLKYKDIFDNYEKVINEHFDESNI